MTLKLMLELHLARYHERLRRQVRTRRFRARVAEARAIMSCDQQASRFAPELLALTMVESGERPEWLRSVEWLLFTLGRRQITTGPLQIRAGPWRYAAALKVAADGLVSLEEEIGRRPACKDVAIFWNGTAARRPGQRFSYEQALETALDVAREEISTWDCGSH